MTPLFGMGWTEVLVIAGVVVVVFGAARIPAVFRSLGEGINSFKEGLEGKGDEGEGHEATADRKAPKEEASRGPDEHPSPHAKG